MRILNVTELNAISGGVTFPPEQLTKALNKLPKNSLPFFALFAAVQYIQYESQNNWRITTSMIDYIAPFFKNSSDSKK